MLKAVAKESNRQFRCKGGTTSDRPISTPETDTKTSRKRHSREMPAGETPAMISTLIIRPAAPADLSDMVALFIELGYPARRETLGGVLDAPLGDPRHAVLVSGHPRDGVVALLPRSS